MTDKIIVTTEKEMEALIERVVRRVMLEQGAKPEHPSNFPLLLSLEDAALFLDLAPQTIYGYTSKRIIPFIKKGKKLYFKKADLEDWLDEGKKKTRTEIEREINATGKFS